MTRSINQTSSLQISSVTRHVKGYVQSVVTKRNVSVQVFYGRGIWVGRRNGSNRPILHKGIEMIVGSCDNSVWWFHTKARCTRNSMIFHSAMHAWYQIFQIDLPRFLNFTPMLPSMQLCTAPTSNKTKDSKVTYHGS